MALALTLFIYLLFEQNVGARGEWGQIKINEPKQQYSSNSYGSYNNDNSNSGSSYSSSYRDPHSETENNEIVISSIVEYFLSRKGDIVEGTKGKYTYKVDLFNKVEQSENWYSWNLGIFDKWDYCDDTQTEICLHYNDGQICGNGHGRSSHVHIVCDIGDEDETKEHLYDVTEPMTCAYHMNMYIPRVCELLNDDINNIFGDGNPNAGAVQEKSENNGDIMNIIGDSTGLMDKLNEIMNTKDDEKELEYLWKLCLMSLMVDDDTKLNKIRNVADMWMLQSDDNDNEESDSEQTHTDICDFYLGKMLNIKEMEQAIVSNDDHEIEEIMDNVEDGDNEKDIEETDDAEEEDKKSKTKMGGLIGEILNRRDEENDAATVVGRLDEENDAVAVVGDVESLDTTAIKENEAYDVDNEELVDVNVGEIGEHDL